MEKHLYVIYVPGGNTALALELIRRTVLSEEEQAFTPRVEREYRRGGETSTETKELFPGYVFIETAEPDSFSERLFLTGGGRTRPLWLIRNDHSAVRLYPEEEDYIRTLVNADYLVEKSYGYKEGDTIKLTRGPLKDLQGSLIRVNRHHRTATIRVKFLGDYRELTLGLEVVSNYTKET